MVVFGIFDKVHKGHQSLFRQAKKYGDELVAIIGRDSAVLYFKNKIPKYSQETRLSLVLKEKDVDKVVLGDNEHGTYCVLIKLNPDVVCFGYDQLELEQNFKEWVKKQELDIKVVRLKPYYPKKYHNSIM